MWDEEKYDEEILGSEYCREEDCSEEEEEEEDWQGEDDCPEEEPQAVPPSPEDTDARAREEWERFVLEINNVIPGPLNDPRLFEEDSLW